MEIAIGTKVIVIKDKFEGTEGKTGVVRELYKTRGEPTVYNVALDGVKRLLSYIDGELRSLEAKVRKRRNPVDDLV